MKYKVIGLLDFHSSPKLPPLTDNRPLGSTSFLGRYACCDFALSNFCNSDISTVGLLVKDHQRSILKHLGSMSSWVKNTKISHEVIMYNEQAHFNPEFNTDLNNIKENDWVLYDSDADYIVVMPAHVICSIDLRPILKEHIERGEHLTVVATRIKDPSQEFRGGYLLGLDEDGYDVMVQKNDGSMHREAIASMGIYIINRPLLADLVRKYSQEYPRAELDEVIWNLVDKGIVKRHVHMFDGFVRCIDSLDAYINISAELLNPETLKELFDPEWPIYTLTHDTPPALYSESAVVQNSFISNGAIVEGTVINSIIARKVKIAPGAVVKNSIIFSSSTIGEGATVEYALIDKYAIVTRNHKVKGKADDFLYVAQGEIK